MKLLPLNFMKIYILIFTAASVLFGEMDFNTRAFRLSSCFYEIFFKKSFAES